MDPDACLRELAAEALRIGLARRAATLPISLGVQATANSFVMLGLLAEDRTEEILASHRSALEARGLTGGFGVAAGELTVRPGAHGYWAAREAGPAGLSEVPLFVAPAGIRFQAMVSGQVADVCFKWVKRTREGWRIGFEATAGFHPAGLPGPPDPPDTAVQQVISKFSLADDTGYRYRLASEFASWARNGDRQAWYGDVLCDPNPTAEPARLDFGQITGTGTQSIAVSPQHQPASIAARRTVLSWQTPAEGYLELLAPVGAVSINGAEVNSEETAAIVAVVADCLMTVGALPVTSPLLFPPHGGIRPEWSTILRARWGRRAYASATEFNPAEHRGLVIQLPLQKATAIIESVSARDSLVSIHLYGHPWVQGEYWPMITPCFLVHATDTEGNIYDGVPGDTALGPGHEGSGSFWFWPPVPETCRKLTVTVGTLWEAASADIDLPR